MKKALKRVQSVLGGNRPTSQLFKQVFHHLSDAEQRQLKKDLFFLAFVHWRELPDYFRRFLVRVFIQDRELLLAYLLEDTPLGDLRYELFDRDLVLKLMFILERNKKTGRISYLHLAFVLLVSFHYPYKLRTMAEYLRKQQPVAGDVLRLSGRIGITGDFD